MNYKNVVALSVAGVLIFYLAYSYVPVLSAIRISSTNDQSLNPLSTLPDVKGIAAADLSPQAQESGGELSSTEQRQDGRGETAAADERWDLSLVPRMTTPSAALPNTTVPSGSLLDRRRDISREELQSLLDEIDPTPEELWLKYSRQIRRLTLKGDCRGFGLNPDVAKLKILAESGDRCAMGSYAHAELAVIGKEYVPNDEVILALQPRVKPLIEYLGLSANTHPFVAGSRACAVWWYFRDVEETLAWQMIHYAYWQGAPPTDPCRTLMPPSDREEIYQRALELSVFYIDYYELATSP